MDTTLRGERFHATMAELASRGWLAKAELGYFVLDREAATFFLRTKSAIFPGMKIAELFGVRGRTALRGDAAATSSTSTAPTTAACATS